MTRQIFLNICRSSFLTMILLAGLLALTLWVKGQASQLVPIRSIIMIVQLSFLSHSTYRWWVKVTLILAVIPLVSLVLDLTNWPWEVRVTGDQLLLLLPTCLALAGLAHVLLTKGEKT